MYPVDLTTGEAGPRSRGLGWAGVIFFLKGVLLIPHILILYVLGALANVVAYVGYFIVAFTGQLPEGLRDILVAVMRWQVRTIGWFAALTDEYPPFAWEEVDYPIRLTVEDPPERSRGLAVAGIFLPIKILMLLPHLIVLWVLSIGAFFAVWFGFLMIAFTGESSEGIHNFLTGLGRWAMRTTAWLQGLTDEYPPFQLSS